MERLEILKDYLSAEKEWSGILDGACEVYRDIYIGKALMDEGNIGKGQLTAREQRKYDNYRKAYDVTFGSIRKLSMQTITEIHRETMRELLENAGEFRKLTAKPAGTLNVWYAEPRSIHDRMANLLFQTLEESPTVKRAARFLVEFLSIYPFSNGNGRIARLLLSFLLLEISPIPVILRSVPREYYAMMLNMARETGNLSEVENYLTESLSDSVNLMCFLLDL